MSSELVFLQGATLCSHRVYSRQLENAEVGFLVRLMNKEQQELRRFEIIEIDGFHLQQSSLGKRRSQGKVRVCSCLLLDSKERSPLAKRGTTERR